MSKKKSNRGGYRPGAGRKPLPPEQRAKPISKAVRCSFEVAEKIESFELFFPLLETYRELAELSPTSPRWEVFRKFDEELRAIGL